MPPCLVPPRAPARVKKHTTQPAHRAGGFDVVDSVDQSRFILRTRRCNQFCSEPFHFPAPRVSGGSALVDRPRVHPIAPPCTHALIKGRTAHSATDSGASNSHHFLVVKSVALVVPSPRWLLHSRCAHFLRRFSPRPILTAIGGSWSSVNDIRSVEGRSQSIRLWQSQQRPLARRHFSRSSLTSW